MPQSDSQWIAEFIFIIRVKKKNPEGLLQKLSLEADGRGPASSASSLGLLEVVQGLGHGLVEGLGQGQTQEPGAHRQAAHERHRQPFAPVGLRACV